MCGFFISFVRVKLSIFGGDRHSVFETGLASAISQSMHKIVFWIFICASVPFTVNFYILIMFLFILY